VYAERSQTIKLKGGVFEQEPRTIDVRPARSFGPGVPLRIDPNALWKVETAIQFGREMEGLLEYLEDPVRGQGKHGNRQEVAEDPFSYHMCTTSFDYTRSSSLGAEDIILSDHHSGRIAGLHELTRICETFGEVFHALQQSPG